MVQFEINDSHFYRFAVSVLLNHNAVIIQRFVSIFIGLIVLSNFVRSVKLFFFFFSSVDVFVRVLPKQVSFRLYCFPYDITQIAFMTQSPIDILFMAFFMLYHLFTCAFCLRAVAFKRKNGAKTKL